MEVLAGEGLQGDGAMGFHIKWTAIGWRLRIFSIGTSKKWSTMRSVASNTSTLSALLDCCFVWGMLAARGFLHCSNISARCIIGRGCPRSMSITLIFHLQL
jgi:hypothetical protein